MLPSMHVAWASCLFWRRRHRGAEAYQAYTPAGIVLFQLVPDQSLQAVLKTECSGNPLRMLCLPYPTFRVRGGWTTPHPACAIAVFFASHSNASFISWWTSPRVMLFNCSLRSNFVSVVKFCSVHHANQFARSETARRRKAAGRSLKRFTQKAGECTCNDARLGSRHYGIWAGCYQAPQPTLPSPQALRLSYDV